MKGFKKLLAVILAVMIVVSMFSIVNFSAFASTGKSVTATVSVLDETTLTDTGATIRYGAESNGTPNLYKVTGDSDDDVASGTIIDKITFDMKPYNTNTHPSLPSRNYTFIYWYKDADNYASFSINYASSTIDNNIIVNGTNTLNVRHKWGSKATWDYPRTSHHPYSLKELNGVGYIDTNDFAHCTLEYTQDKTIGDHYLLTVETDANTTWGGGKTTKVSIPLTTLVDWNNHSEYNSTLVDMQVTNAGGTLMYNGGLAPLTDLYLTNTSNEQSAGTGLANIKNYMQNVTVTYDKSSLYSEEIEAFVGLWNQKLEDCEKSESAYNQLLEDYEIAISEADSNYVELLQADEFRLKIANAIEKTSGAKAVYEFNSAGIKNTADLNYKFVDRVKTILNYNTEYSYGVEDFGKSYIKAAKVGSACNGFVFPNIGDNEVPIYRLEGEVKLSDHRSNGGTAFIYGMVDENGYDRYLATSYSLFYDEAGGITLTQGVGSVQVNDDGTKHTATNNNGGTWCGPSSQNIYTSRKSYKCVTKTDVYTPATSTFGSTTKYYSRNGETFSAVTTDETDFATNYVNYYTLASTSTSKLSATKESEDSVTVTEADGVYTVVTVTNTYGYYTSKGNAAALESILTTDNIDEVAAITELTGSDRWVNFATEYRGIGARQPYNVFDFNIGGVEFTVDKYSPYWVSSDNSQKSVLGLGFTNSGANGADVVLFDNIKAFYNTSIDDAVNEFAEQYSEILSKDESNVENSDLEVIEETIKEFKKLSSEAEASEKGLAVYNKLLFLKDVLKGVYDYDKDDLESIVNTYCKVKYANQNRKQFLFNIEEKLLAHLEDYRNAHPEATQKKKIKVLFVGHSMVIGFGVPGGAPNRYPSQLETLIQADNQSGLEFEFDNIACGGTKISAWNSDDSKFALRAKSYQPDIIVVTIGVNDEYNLNFESNYNKMLDYFETFDSKPTIVMTTEMHMIHKNMDNYVAAQRRIANERGVYFMDFYDYTKKCYEEDLQAYKDQGLSDDEAFTKVQQLWFGNLETGALGDKAHYNAYGYSRVAEYAKTYFDKMYNEFSLPYSGMKNIIFYSEDDVVTKEQGDTPEEFNALTYKQKKYYKHYFNEEFNKISADLTAVAGEIDGFKDSYGEFIAKLPENITVADLQDYSDAKDAYIALSAAAKDGLKDEKAKLDAILEAITEKLVEDYIANGIAKTEKVTAHNISALNKAFAKINAMSADARIENGKAFTEIKEAILRYSDDSPTIDTRIRVACVGDSITRGSMSSEFLDPHPYPSYLATYLGDGYNVFNAGVGGATVNSYGNERYHRQALEFMPNIVLFMFGTNDVDNTYWGKVEIPPEDLVPGGVTYERYLRLINQYRSLESAPTLILSTAADGAFHDYYGPEGGPFTNNEKLAQFNQMVKELAKNEGLVCMDLWTLTHSWDAYDANAEVNYFADDDLHFTKEGYEQIALYFNQFIKRAESDVEFGYLNSIDSHILTYVEKQTEIHTQTVL